MDKITYAGTASRSYLEGSGFLHKLAGLDVDTKQVERVTRAIGAERVCERDAAVRKFQELPLAEKFTAPAGVSAPDLAVVMVDGGRMQIRDSVETKSAAAADMSTTTSSADAPEPEWEEEVVEKKGHWREDRVGLLLAMESKVCDCDPSPEIPESFVDPTRIPRLVRELKKRVKQGEDAVADSAEPEIVEQTLAEDLRYEPPQVQTRQVVASRYRWHDFAAIVAQAAWQQGFQGAKRKAFVADGAKNNWVLQRRFFASFVPVLDFIHALSYVFAGALAGRKFAEGWLIYTQWIRWLWQGKVAQVIAALEARQAELGKPAADDADTSPRQVVARALQYLSNHQDKMHYDQYRQEGLPMTSSHMESMVKQINQRVKGTEKFWSEEGGEAILQLRADHLSDAEPLVKFWQRRQHNATGQRQYRKAS